MNILVINGSPKGKNSTTVHTARYLEARNPEHHFTYVNAASRIRRIEKDFSEMRGLLERADMLLFCYPVYTFLAPYQIHRLIELIKRDGVSLSGKFASQITTSKHFFDVTAHKYIENNCFDLGMKVIRGLSADMDDLLTEKGQTEAEMFFSQLIYSAEQGLCQTPPAIPPVREKEVYTPVLPKAAKSGKADVVVITNASGRDYNLLNMIQDFRSALPHPSRVVNIRDFPFSGGCLGCLNCAVTGACIYRDGFDKFLRTEIQNADAFVYAFTISDHYTHSSFKCYDDRQFCNGHRTVTSGTPIAYIISGNYSYEANLRMVVEGRSEVGGNYLAGVAGDERDTSAELERVANNLSFALEHKFERPKNFYGVGGTKIFRDLIYLMQGMMKADHQFYKKNGIYDFPQNQKKRILQMKFVGFMMSIPSVKRKMKSQMNRYIIGPYEDVVQNAFEERREAK